MSWNPYFRRHIHGTDGLPLRYQLEESQPFWQTLGTSNADIWWLFVHSRWTSDAIACFSRSPWWFRRLEHSGILPECQAQVLACETRLCDTSFRRRIWYGRVKLMPHHAWPTQQHRKWYVVKSSRRWLHYDQFFMGFVWGCKTLIFCYYHAYLVPNTLYFM